MSTGDQDYRCGMACGRVVPCGLCVVPYGARRGWPDPPTNFVEAQPIPERDPLAGYRFPIGVLNSDVIPEPPARARRNRRHRRAPLWAPEATGHVTRRGRGEVGRLRARER